MFCLKAPVRMIHFSLHVHLSWNGRFIFFFIFFFCTCQKLAIFFYKYEKSKCKLSRPILSDRNLVSSQLLSQFSAPLSYKRDDSDLKLSQQVVKKKEKKKTHSASIFENLESFETEHYVFLVLHICRITCMCIGIAP